MSQLVYILHYCDDDVVQHCIILCGLDPMEGTKSEWLAFRALYLELWRGAGAPENEMHEEEVSE